MGREKKCLLEGKRFFTYTHIQCARLPAILCVLICLCPHFQEGLDSKIDVPNVAREYATDQIAIEKRYTEREGERESESERVWVCLSVRVCLCLCVSVRPSI